MAHFTIVDNRHTTPGSPPSPSILGFIAARLGEEEATDGTQRRIKDPTGKPCPDCDRTIISVHLSPEDATVRHGPGRLDRCTLSGQQWDTLATGELTKHAKRTLKRVLAFREVLDDILGYEMSIDIDRGTGQGVADAATTPAIQVIASIWDDHPDYDQAWRLT